MKNSILLCWLMFASSLLCGASEGTEPTAYATATPTSKDLANNTTMPNIVILYADDMGYGDLGAQNPESKIPTPHLDRLAVQGTRFTDAHSSSGVCTPSRYAMLQGRYHWRKFHGIVNSFDQPILDADKTTLAELLRQQGYKTACIGKWHLGWDWNAIKKAGSQEQVVAGEGKKKAAGSANGYTSHTSPGELYNLREDISQRNNLYAVMPDKVSERTRRLEQVRSKSQVR